MAIRKLRESALLIRALGTTLYGSLYIWLIFKGGLFLLGGVIFLIILSAFEFYRMISHAGNRPYWIIGILTAMLFPLDSYFNGRIFSGYFTIMVVVSIIWIGLRSIIISDARNEPTSNLFLNWSYTFAGSIYAGALLSHSLLIRALPGGGNLLLLVILGSAMCDSAAYVIGTYLGKHKFVPRLSPKKTWEGAIGGLIVCIATVPLTVNLMHIEIDFLHSLLLGFIIGISVIMGDLFESMLKRSSGVKDSGSWIPKQGGVLDVIDGVMLSVTTSYYFFLLLLDI